MQRRYQSLVKHFLSSPFCKASTVLVVIKMKTRVRRASRKPGPRRGPNPGDTAHDYIYIYLIYISIQYVHPIPFLDGFFWVQKLQQREIRDSYVRTVKSHRGLLKAKYGCFQKIGVPPNHPILIGFSIINHPFWGTSIIGNTHISWWKLIFSLFTSGFRFKRLQKRNPMSHPTKGYNV